MQPQSYSDVVEEILAKDPRYQAEAYHFVREGLDHTQKTIGKANHGKYRHVTGQELLKGLRRYALTQYGPMALALLNEWGIQRCEDFGEIVFNLIDQQVLSRTATDSRADFQGGYDFAEAFRKPFLPKHRWPQFN